MNIKHNDIPPELERYLALCKRTYENMVHDGSWPWKEEADSTLTKDMVDSGDNPENL